MGNITVLGANIPRASEELIETLIKFEFLYVGEDNELLVNESLEGKNG